MSTVKMTQNEYDALPSRGADVVYEVGKYYSANLNFPCLLEYTEEGSDAVFSLRIVEITNDE